jgi:phosphatidylglycerol:prolipoprotein diacylglycerol transferase
MIRELSSTRLAALLFSEQHYWVDRLNPWAVHFRGDFGIRWYGIAYLAGILFAYLVFVRWAKRGRLPVPVDEVSTLIVYAAFGVVVGGRLGYCVLYNLHYVLHHPLEIIAVWHGGMASHGGILGMIIAIWIFARQRRLDPWIFLDAAAATGPIGIFFGRISNFINGELWGRPTTVPWAVIFPDAPLVHGVNVPRHPSQLYAAGIEGLMVFAVAQWVFHHQRRTGMTTAAVCIAYGIGRFVDEFWRQPDLGQPVFWGWMSKGQLYTIPMLLTGVALVLWRRRAARVETNEGTEA